MVCCCHETGLKPVLFQEDVIVTVLKYFLKVGIVTGLEYIFSEVIVTGLEYCFVIVTGMVFKY